LTDMVVLIVPENDRQFGSLAKAIRAVGVNTIEQVRSAKEAIHWISLYECDVCVISQEVPGGRNGLTTLLDMRSHRPGLRAIIVSSSHSEKVAVGAFHAGIVDYVPIGRGYEREVANLISQIKTSPAGSSIVPAPIVPAEFNDRLLQPTYQNRLRVIGRHLDLYDFRRVNVLEVEGGFIVRAALPNSRTTETIEFVDQNFVQLMVAATTDRGDGERMRAQATGLLPTGYEDFLRATGFQLDYHAAEAVTISELDEVVAVGGIGRVDETGISRLGPIQWLFRAKEVAALLDQAYRRRGVPQNEEMNRAAFSRR
jgi:DNA-binding NarL/FixJ family response regulator